MDENNEEKNKETKLYKKEEEKDLLIQGLKKNLKNAKEIMNKARQIITKIQLAMIKHKASYEKVIDVINDANAWFTDPYELTTINTEVDLQSQKVLNLINEPEEPTNTTKIRNIINELEKTTGYNIPIEDITKKAQEQGISKEEIEETIRKLKRKGDIFNPKHGMISKT